MRLDFGRRPTTRAVTFDKIFGESVPINSKSGTHVSEKTALKYSVVWRSTALIADAVSSLDPEAYRESADGSISPIAVPRWIRTPHPEQTRLNVWHQLLVSLLLWGNAYALFIRSPQTGQIIGFRPLDPAAVQCEWDLDRPGFRRYRIQIDNKAPGPWLTSYDVFHLQGLTMPGQPTGLSPIAQAREAIGLGLTLEEFGARYFSQGSMHKVVIKLPGNNLSSDRIRDIVKEYERFHRGPGNWHRPAVLSGPTGTDITNVSIPPNDAQFLQSREFQAIDVARWFGVPPHRVGIISKQSSWGSGLAEENTMLVQHTLRRYIMLFESMFTLYSPGGDSGGTLIRLNDSALMRGTFAEQITAFVEATGGPVLTVNEARKELGREPVEGGEKMREKIDPAAAKDGENKNGEEDDEEEGNGDGASQDDSTA